MTDSIELTGCDARLNIFLNHFELFCGHSADSSHFFDFVRGFNVNCHRVIVSGTSLDSGHDMASRRRFSFKKRLMVLLQNRYQFSVKTADDSLPKSRMALCSKKLMVLCQNR
jgi:hypothetical protein